MKMVTFLLIIVIAVSAYSQDQNGDVNCDEALNILDIVYLINDIYKEGPEPCMLAIENIFGWVDDGNVVRLETTEDSVGIGTSTPTEKLDVAGNIRASGTVTIGNTSDGYEFPKIDGELGEVLMTDGNGQLSWITLPGIAYKVKVGDPPIYYSPPSGIKIDSISIDVPGEGIIKLDAWMYFFSSGCNNISVDFGSSGYLEYLVTSTGHSGMQFNDIMAVESASTIKAYLLVSSNCDLTIREWKLSATYFPMNYGSK